MASLEVLRALMTVCCLALYVYAQSGRGAPIDTSNANQPVRGSIPPSRYKDPDQGVKTPYLSNQRPDPKRGDSSGGLDPVRGNSRSPKPSGAKLSNPEATTSNKNVSLASTAAGSYNGTSETGGDNCMCSILPDKLGASLNDEMVIAFRALESKLVNLETKVKLQVSVMGSQQSDRLTSLMNDTFSLKYDVTNTKSEVSRIESARMLLESRVTTLEVVKNDIAALNNNYDNVWAKLQMLSRKTENLAEFGPELARKTDRTANTTRYLQQELSALKEISAQLDDVRQQVAEVGKSESLVPQPLQDRISKPRDCDDIVANGNLMSGVYEIWPAVYDDRSVQVYCEISGGKGWIVLQRRQDGSTDFRRSWKDYEWGFGSMYGDFWLGNSLISALTLQGTYQLRIEIVNWDNVVKQCYYNQFHVQGREDKYKLIIGEKVGDADMKDPMAYHNGTVFSTYDQDFDTAPINCASKYNSGWWFGYCLKANLNGRYYMLPDTTQYSNQQYRDGIVWLDGSQTFEGQLPPAIKITSMSISRVKQTFAVRETDEFGGDLPMNK